jgi:sarcosine oxidase
MALPSIAAVAVADRARKSGMGEFIVLGAGLAGASAAWHLTLRGHSVTVLERSTPGNPEGSSHGSARIFRYAYPEQLYTDLVVRARRGWDELQRQSGRELIRVTGCVDFGELRGPEELAAVLAGAGVPHELLSRDAAGARWPQFTFDTPVLWQPTAGVLDPAGTIEAMLELARASGRARILTDWEATEVQTTATGVRVRSATGETVEGSRVVVAAGGWLPDLLPGGGLPADLVAAMPPLEVRQEQAFHFPYRESGGTPIGSAWPALIHKSPAIMTYSLPGGRDADFRGQKLAQFNGGRVIASARDQDGQISDENRQLMVDYVQRHLPGLVPEPYAETTCLFTNTPTEDFIIDARENVVLVSACSGHGAKFAPLLGELAADLALGTGSVPAALRLDGRHAPSR